MSPGQLVPNTFQTVNAFYLACHLSGVVPLPYVFMQSPADEPDNVNIVAAAATREFVCQRARASEPTPGATVEDRIDVGPSLEGINPLFRSNMLKMARVEG